MKEHYVSYEQSQALKRLGFDWEVRGYYTRDDNFQKAREVTALNHNDTKKFKNILSAPRLDQAQAWLRDCKGIDIEVVTILNLAHKTKSYKANLCYFGKNESGEDCANYKIACLNIHSYVKALELGISKALELLGKEVNNA